MPVTPISVSPTAIDGCVVITAKRAEDERGAVREVVRPSDLLAHGITFAPVQVNLTQTRRGAVRGVHAESMTKLVGVAAGEAFGAYVDLRPGPRFGTTITVPLVLGTHVLVPAGVGNAFQAVTDCEYLYCFDAEWQPGMAGSAVHPLDPELAIAWPVPIDAADPSQLSAKDAAQPSLSDLRAAG